MFTMLRVVLLVPLSISLFHLDEWGWIPPVAIGVIMILTDLVDGPLARRLHQITWTGGILDTIADKVILFTLSLILAILGLFPYYFAIFLGLRYISLGIVGLRYIKREKKLLKPTFIGRITELFWGISYILAVLKLVGGLQWLNIAMWVSALLALLLAMISTIVYFIKFISGKEGAPAE